MKLLHETMTHYFSCSGGTGIDSTKDTLGHVTQNLSFMDDALKKQKLSFVQNVSQSWLYLH
jgi:hypothetical protein